MTLFWLAFIANTITLAIAIAAAVMRPTLFYRLLAFVAICAFLAALHQVLTAESNHLVLLLGALLIALMFRRLRLDELEKKNNRRP